MDRNAKSIVAKNYDAKKTIVECAMNSWAGRLVYRKWDAKTKKFIRNSYVVIPIDCGVTSRGNNVIYVEDVDQNLQVKMFIIKQIVSFENLKEKHKTAFPIKVDNIKKMFGISTVALQQEESKVAGATRRDSIVAKMERIAQNIYEFSGCEGHLYSDSKKKDSNSYDVVVDDGRIGRIARSVVAFLTESQKRITDEFTQKRPEGLSFGDYFKWDSNGRVFMPLSSSDTVQDINKINDANAREIAKIIDDEGYVCPDYASGYCYEKSDKDFASKNPPKVITLLKKSFRKKKIDQESLERLQKAFNEREVGTMKHKGNMRLVMCITHNPDDIAGMSTDRGWTSCMKLPSFLSEVSETELKRIVESIFAFATKFSDAENERTIFNAFCDFNGILGHNKQDMNAVSEKYGISDSILEMYFNKIEWKINSGGQYYPTALKQVKYGGMVAYLLREDDKDINKPFARIAIKRFQNGAGGFLFRHETRIYGDEHVAEECGFMHALAKELDASNNTTMTSVSREYRRSDGGSWSDSLDDIDYDSLDVDSLCKMQWRDVYEIIRGNKVQIDEEGFMRILDAHRNSPPLGIFDAYEENYGRLSRQFIRKYAKWMDTEKYDYATADSEKNYVGDDAPHSVKEMVGALYDKMEEVRYGDDYGVMIEGYEGFPEFSGNVSPLIAIGCGDIPSAVRTFCLEAIADSLEDYFKGMKKNDYFKDKFSKYLTYASFEDDFFNGKLDDKVHEDVLDDIAYDLGNAFVGYSLETSVEAVEEEVYKIRGWFTYYFPYESHGINRVKAYENSTSINVKHEGWKEKLTAYVEDLFDSAVPELF